MGRLCELVEEHHPRLSMRTQCQLLGVARSSLDYQPVAQSREDLALKRLLDELYLRDAERNAAALERYGIDGLRVFRLARASVRRDGSIECREEQG